MKRINVTVTAAVYSAAAGVVFLVFGCDDSITPPPEDPEFGTAELIYTLSSDVIYNATLSDVSANGGTYVLKSYDENTEERSLWILDVADGEPRLIASDPDHWWGYATLSPDKTNIVFEDPDGIYILPVNGGEPWLVYAKVIDAQPYAWIDNDKVLLVTAEDRWYVKTVNINTLETYTLTSIKDNNVHSAALSPNGDKLFVSCEHDPDFDLGEQYYYARIYDTDTWEYEEYIDMPSAGSGPWSPDATKVSYIEITSVPGSYVRYFDIANEEVIDVFHSNKLVFYGYRYGWWTPDGRYIIASAKNDDGDLKVYRVLAE
jgi:WD40 repeat protein